MEHTVTCMIVIILLQLLPLVTLVFVLLNDEIYKYKKVSLKETKQLGKHITTVT